jgi:hypothetical protein
MCRDADENSRERMRFKSEQSIVSGLRTDETVFPYTTLCPARVARVAGTPDEERCTHNS